MPTGHLRSYVEHYFAPHPSQQVRELFMSRAILDFATGSVMIFEPIYLWSLGYSMSWILLFYGAVYVLYFFALPIGGMICRRHGFERTILLSSPFLIVWYLAFFAIPLHPAFAPLAIVSLVIQKILYWPGYHANFATWSEKKEGGREVSNMAVFGGMAAILAPAFGGFLISVGGFRALFIAASVLILASNVPLLRTPELFMPQRFSYAGAFRRLARPEHRRSLFAFIGFGEELIALVAWPLFIAAAVSGYAVIGLVVSLAMFVNVLATLYIGRISDDGAKVPVLRSGVIYTTASWLVRPLVAGSLGVFLIDSFYRVSKNMVNVPLVALLYGGAKSGNTVMEDVVFFEMALSIGKALAAGGAAVLLLAWPGSWTPVFLLAAAFTVLYAFFRERRE